MSGDNLRECPFCGKNMQKRDWEPDSEYIVWCQNCGAIGPNELAIERSDEMWNLRRPEAELRARIAELEAQTRWIPVSERLPEDNVRVLIFDGNGVAEAKHALSVKQWKTPDGYYYHGLGYDWITHWMPFPEPPENV